MCFNPLIAKLIRYSSSAKSNIFVSENGIACIGDIRLPHNIIEALAGENRTAWYLHADPRWQAPELLKAETVEESSFSDIFSYGRVIFEASISIIFIYLERICDTHAATSFRFLLEGRHFRISIITMALSRRFWTVLHRIVQTGLIQSCGIWR